MKKWIESLDELTEYQREHARDQYVYLRSCEEEISEEKYLRKNFKYKGCLGDMHEDKNLVKKVTDSIINLGIDVKYNTACNNSCTVYSVLLLL